MKRVLGAARDETLWRRAKSTAQSRTGRPAIEFLLGVLPGRAFRSTLSPSTRLWRNGVGGGFRRRQLPSQRSSSR